MINPFRALTRPEYLFRPRQILHRFRRALRPPGEMESVRLPWGRDLRVHTRETIGACIYSYGIFDLPVCEAITRLLDPGELALDIGANIGQMSSLMRHRAGAGGRVISFEPHPEIFAELSANMQPASGDGTWAPADLHAIALSEKPGELFLDTGKAWAGNRGVSRLVETPTAVRVPVARLDDMLPGGARPAFCKIDVEGHEAAVFAGGARLIASDGARDIVFEDFHPYPGVVPALLTARGYRVFRLRTGLFGPRLAPPENPGAERANEPGRDYLATREPERAIARFRPRGWRVLRG